MAEANSSINPWVRANLYQPDPETRELVPAPMREHYDMVIENIGRTSTALALAHEGVSVAQSAYAQAQDALAAFYGGLAYESAL